MCYNADMGKNKKGNTVYEDKAIKEEKRRQKRQTELEKHTYACPHCFKPVLDHMTKCPHCNGELEPAGYKPMDPKKEKRIKAISYTVFFAIAIAIVVMVLVFKK